MDNGRLESFPFKEQVIKAGKEHACYSDNGTLVSAMFFDSVILGAEIRVVLVQVMERK